MANNIGKKFESKFAECWRKSFPNTFLYRIPDQQSQYYGSSANPCDFIAFVKGNLFLIETKSHKGNTVPWNAFRQYDRLLPFKDLKDVYPGVIIWFIDYDRILWYDIKDVERMKKDGKKSINIKDSMLYNSVEIPSIKKRTFLDSDYSVLVKRLEDGNRKD